MSPGPPSPGPPPAPFDPYSSLDPGPHYIEGIDWKEHRINPREIDERVVSIGGAHPNLRPWIFLRPETGSTLNFPVRQLSYLRVKGPYLDSIWEARLGTDGYSTKTFTYGFPRLAKDATQADLCNFLVRVTNHCQGYGVYVPPFHTMEFHNHTGYWYDDLPDHCRSKWGFYDETLRQALTSSYAALGDNNLTRHLLTQTSGYQIIWRIAAIAGHPALQTGTVTNSMPRQSSKMTFKEYMDRWLHYIHIQFVQGIFINERYFLEQFFDRLHSTFNNTLKPLFLSLIRDIPLNTAVPVHFTPDRLIDHIQQKGYHIGITTISHDSIPDDFRTSKTSSSSRLDRSTSKSSLDRSSKTMNVLETTDLPSDPTDDAFDLRLLATTPEDIVLQISSLVAANVAANRRCCDLCGSDSHLIAACPMLKKVIQDPVKARRLLDTVKQAVDSGGGNNNSSRSRPPSLNPSRTRNVRQVLDDTDEDTIDGRLTDDDDTVTDDSASDVTPKG